MIKKFTVVFRVDASHEIGSGHVMRCLTLAQSFADKGGICFFICRQHMGHLIDLIKEKGFQALSLPIHNESILKHRHNRNVSLSTWLGCNQKIDAEQTISALARLKIKEKVDWLVVDHYGIDEQWENIFRGYSKKIMVIDDLADRKHDCDVLLDQTLLRKKEDYFDYVKGTCRFLLGSEYTILRPEFRTWREFSLGRRNLPQIKQLLITLGGVDKENVTEKVLDLLNISQLQPECHITVVLGRSAPWVKNVTEKARKMKIPTEVKSDVKNMAQLMAGSDLCIGAAGSTSWERCCLGLPTISIVLADNQKLASTNLSKLNAALCVSSKSKALSIIPRLILQIITDPTILTDLARQSSEIVDGYGTERVTAIIQELTE